MAPMQCSDCTVPFTKTLQELLMRCFSASLSCCCPLGGKSACASLSQVPLSSTGSSTGRRQPHRRCAAAVSRPAQSAANSPPIRAGSAESIGRPRRALGTSCSGGDADVDATHDECISDVFAHHRSSAVHVESSASSGRSNAGFARSA